MSGVPRIVDTARRLRREMSLPEVLLWEQLRRRPDGIKFRRQHAIGDYVLDFYCAAAHLAIKIDGPGHDATVGYDAARDDTLAARGIRCVRITAPRVLADPSGVAAWLALEAVGPTAPPLHHRKGDGSPPRAGEDQGFVPCR